MRIAPRGIELVGVAQTVLRDTIAPHIPAQARPALHDVEAALALAADKLRCDLPVSRAEVATLETARTALRTTLLVQLPKERQYDARLVAKVIAIATNVLVNGSDLDRQERDRAAVLFDQAPPQGTASLENGELARLYVRLCADIRAGRTDPGSPRYAITYAHLCRITREAVGESNPSYLQRAPTAAPARTHVP